MIMKIKNLNFEYKKRQSVISNLTLDIGETGIDTFLGHNGAGKTTLFLLISGHLKVPKGSIVFNKNIIDTRRKIAYVPEKGGYLESLTVYENLKFRYLLSAEDEMKMDETINYYLQFFDMKQYSDSLSKNLSSGCQKRLSIICALISKPKLLLLDEPTNGVDPFSRELLINTIMEYSNNGTKILINTHDLEFASLISSTAIVLDHGRIIANKIVDSNISVNELKSMYLKLTNPGGVQSNENS